MSADRSDLVGRTLGRYRVLAHLGSGGMGEVYQAQDTVLERPVALKFLSNSLVASSGDRDRFLTEARAAAALDHASICAVYEIGELEGRLYIAMAYIPGETLREKISRGPLPLAEAFAIASQVADGLAEAHAHGIVHRDIKPENIIITPRGQVKITDFGLAKRPGVTLTQAGATIGTPAYMSPEQIRGETADQRSDIWSLGVMIYEMLAGCRPFEGEQIAAVLYSIVNEEPQPLASQRPEVTSGIQRLVMRTLVKNREDRLADVSELKRTLNLILTGSNLATPATIVTPPPEPGGCPVTLAVLPMSDLSPEKDQEYFCDGLAEELINTLSRIEGLCVVARTSAFAFKGQSLDVRTIGARLGVSSVLEGSVRKSGQHLRISAQLVNVADGYHIWSERFDRDASDVFAIQDEIAQTVANRLRLQIEKQATPPTHNIEAYDLYMQGRYHWNKRTNEESKRALALFEAAVALDPNFAPAYAGISDTYLILEDHGFIGFREALSRARAAVEKALSLDDSLAEAHTAMAAIQAELRDYERADWEFRRAIELNPGYATAHHWYSTQLLLDQGKIDQAEREIIRASELDPLSLIINTDLARHFYYRREFARTVNLLQRVFAMDAGFVKARRLMCLALGQLGRHEEAAAEIPKWLPAYAGLEHDDTNWRELLKDSGVRGVWRQLLHLMTTATKGYPLHYAIACTYAQLGETEGALKWLEKSVEDHMSNLAGLRFDASLDPVRSHPRFLALLNKLAA